MDSQTALRVRRKLGCQVTKKSFSAQRTAKESNSKVNLRRLDSWCIWPQSPALQMVKKNFNVLIKIIFITIFLIL